MSILSDPTASRKAASAEFVHASINASRPDKPAIPQGIGHRRTPNGFVSIPVDFVVDVKPKAKGGKYCPSDRRILEYLALESARFNYPGVWPTLKTIKNALGLGIRTIQESLDRLQEGGWIAITEELHKGKVVCVKWLRWLLFDDASDVTIEGAQGFKFRVQDGAVIHPPRSNPAPRTRILFSRPQGAEKFAQESAQEGVFGIEKTGVSVPDEDTNANAAPHGGGGEPGPIPPVVASPAPDMPEPGPIPVAPAEPTPIPVAECLEKLATMNGPRAYTLLAGPYLWALEDQDAADLIPVRWRGKVPARPPEPLPPPVAPVTPGKTAASSPPDRPGVGQGRDAVLVGLVGNLGPHSGVAEIKAVAVEFAELWDDWKSIGFYKSLVRRVIAGTLAKRKFLASYREANAANKPNDAKARLFTWLVNGES